MVDTVLNVTLRPATPADAEAAAGLMHATMGTLGDYVFGGRTPGETIRFLARNFRAPGHRYSFSYTTLAVSESAVVGLLDAIPGAKLMNATWKLLFATASTHGPLAAWDLLRRGMALASEPDAMEDEYYVECLSVAPAQRNRGIGGLLLAEAERLAKRADYRKCSLGVFFENEAARRLYERTGYRVEEKVYTKLRAPGVEYKGFYRMVKELD